MTAHTNAKEAVTAQKIVGVSEAEAQQAANALLALSTDSEVGLGDKSAATLIHRELQASVGKAQARGEVMGRATALVNRIA